MQERLLARRDPFERKASKLVQYPKPVILKSRSEQRLRARSRRR
jgi:hypothetical protein